MTHEASPEEPPASARKKLQFSDRLLAESVGIWEQLARPAEVEFAEANRHANHVGGDLEEKVILRAQRSPASQEISDATRQVRRTLRLFVAVGIVVAALAGVAAAQATLGVRRDEPVNIFLVVGSLLGFQIVFLVLWIVLIVFGARSSATSLSVASFGGILLRIGRKLATWLHHDAHHAAAITAIVKAITHGSYGRWTLSAISHSLWIAFNVGCLTLVILLLSARQYVFVWETTILSDEAYVSLTRSLATVPNALEFPTPTDEQIAASQWKDETSGGEIESSRAWSGFLLGIIILYGLAPRVILLVLSLGKRRLASRRYRLDLTRSEFLEAVNQLAPASGSIGVVDPADDEELPENKIVQRTGQQRELSQPVIFALEVSRDDCGSLWPPPVHAVRWEDMGFLDGRDDQHQALQHLKESSTEPSTTAVVCSLINSPDRGIGSFLIELQKLVTQPVTFILTGGQQLRERVSVDQFERRVADWKSLATSTGILPERIVELDLAHWTQASAAKLADVMGSSKLQSSPRRIVKLETAFQVIVQHVQQWEKAGRFPSDAETAELHRATANVYKSEHLSWRPMFGNPTVSSENLSELVKGASSRITNLLPSRLRQESKWLAAGVAAGAFGCIAAATLISPVAISALPFWSVLGGVLAAVVRPTRNNENEQEIPEYGDSVRSAALFAMLLQLQGRDETTITRILDRAIDPRVDAQMTSVQSANEWLITLLHRFEQSIAELGS